MKEKGWKMDNNIYFESKIKLNIYKYLADDFDLFEEVPGNNPLANKKVRIDFLANPKKHLIDRGFSNIIFGVEAKHISAENEPMKKIKNIFWQAITYRYSSFFLKEKLIKPEFILVCHDLELDPGSDLSHDYKIILDFVSRANIGNLVLQENWLIEFHYQRYFSKRLGKSKVINLENRIHSGSE